MFACADLLDQQLYEVRVHMTTTEPHLLMVTSKRGTIKHMSGAMAKVLGVASAVDAMHPHHTQYPGNEISMAVHTSVLPEAALKVQDFLPQPWKHLHPKYLKDVCMPAQQPGHTPFSCRTANGAMGPTLVLADLKGRPVYLRTSVSTSDESGEMLHVARFERSSVEAGAAERRLRLRVTADGVIRSITSGVASALFGLDEKRMVGAHLWEYVSLIVPWDHDDQDPAAAGRDAKPGSAAAADSTNSRTSASCKRSRSIGPAARETQDDLAGVLDGLNHAKGRRLLDALVKR